MMLSVVIPTLNEENYLPSLLEDLMNQTYNNFEIIVSDCKSVDNTVKIAKKFDCRTVICEKKGPGPARNRGASVAKGKYLLFLDADSRVPEEQFLERLMQKAEKKFVRLATLGFSPIEDNKLDKTISKYIVKSLKIFGTFEPFSPGFCTFVSKHIHDKIGGYDEELFLSEDHEYVKRASKMTKFFVIDDICVLFSSRRLIAEGRFNLYLKYFYVTLYRFLNGEIRKKICDYDFGNY
ncbi:MAG: glycosyltransferase [archaeon]|nr:MAG: glycosyltransferase [archaeon]